MWVADDRSPVHVGVGKVVLKQDVQRTHVVAGMCVTCIFKLKHVQTRVMTGMYETWLAYSFHDGLLFANASINQINLIELDFKNKQIFD